MRKCLLLLLLLFVRYMPSIAQAADSLKIDSLEKQWPLLKDSNKVDCLNALALAGPPASRSPRISWAERADSTYHYASIAYTEAKKIHYKKGMAASLMNLANSEYLRGIDLRIHKQNDSATLTGTLIYLSQALPLAQQVQDDETLGYIYGQWGDMLYIKSKFRDDDSRAEYYIKSIDHFRKSGNEYQEGENCTWLAERYTTRGYYEEALKYCSRGLELSEKRLRRANNKEEKEYSNFLYQQSLADMATLYEAAGDYQTALVYLNQSRQFGISRSTGWDMSIEKAEVFSLLGHYDSSFYYLNELRRTDIDNPDFRAGIQLALGRTFLLTNQVDSALAYLKPALLYFKKRYFSRLNFGNETLVFSLLYMGSASLSNHEYSDAASYTREGMAMAAYLGIRPRIMQGYELLSRIHRQLGNNDSAYQYLLRYTTLKDSIESRQFIFRLNSLRKAAEDAKKESQIGFLNRDNQIKRQQLKQGATFRNFIIAALVAFVFAGLYVYRNINVKRKNERLTQQQKEQAWKLKELESEKKQIELQKQSAELEMQALRAQMNPHFIFNSLSSINHFILKNESKMASNYLTRFSRLIRMVLINSQKPLITLQDELEMLRIYLDMERLRSKDSFDYFITSKNEINAETVFVPPLILQPFCENAIRHGLMNKEGQGHLTIDLSISKNFLECIISDDGIGRDRAAEIKNRSGEGEKSVGLQITTQRLALLNQNRNVETFFTIDDIIDEDQGVTGTKVVLKISHQILKEELV